MAIARSHLERRAFRYIPLSVKHADGQYAGFRIVGILGFVSEKTAW
jgi:hypothetical protein